MLSADRTFTERKQPKMTFNADKNDQVPSECGDFMHIGWLIERTHAVHRKRLGELSDGVRERAKWARIKAAENPSLVEQDDELLPWVYCESDGMWYSFDGNYSTFSPEQKFQKKLDREQMREERYEAWRLWSAIRQEVLERDEHQCQMCGREAPSKLHIHHIMKRKDGGTDHPDNLLTLCPQCHSKADRKFYNPDWTQPPNI